MRCLIWEPVSGGEPDPKESKWLQPPEVLAMSRCDVPPLHALADFGIERGYLCVVAAQALSHLGDIDHVRRNGEFLRVVLRCVAGLPRQVRAVGRVEQAVRLFGISCAADLLKRKRLTRSEVRLSDETYAVTERL